MAKTRTVRFDLGPVCEGFFGTTLWRAKLARQFGVDEKTVRRWEESGMVPVWVPLAIDGLIYRSKLPQPDQPTKAA